MNIRALYPLLLAFSLMCVLFAPALIAAESDEQPAGIVEEVSKLYLRADHREFDYSTGIGVVSGNVRFLIPNSNQLIAADAGVIWVERREAYLEGNIRIYRTLGSSPRAGEFDVPKPKPGERKGLEPIESIEPAGDVDAVVEPEPEPQTILVDPRTPVSEAEHLYINWGDGTAYLVEPTLRFTEAGSIANFIIHAPSVEEIATYRVPVVDENGKPTGKYESRRHFVANNATFTTCSFKKPHTKFVSTSAEWAEDDFASIHNVVFRAGNTSLFYLPYVWNDFEYDWPTLDFAFGNSSRLGYFVSTRIAAKIIRGLSIEPHIDMMSSRGTAYGIDSHYAFGREREVRGSLTTFWLPNDHGNDELADTSREDSPWPGAWPPILGPLPDDIPTGVTNRYRFSYWHQQEYPEHWELDVEVNKFSDANVYREYFEQEFKTAKPPETRAELKYRRDNWSAFIHVKPRINDFETQTEYLPQIGFNLIAQPIGGGFLFTSQTQIANVRTRFADTRRALGQTQVDIVGTWIDRNEYSVPPALTLRENDSDDLQNWRFDTVNFVSRPFKAGIVNIEPYFGVRESWFEHTLDRTRGGYLDNTPPVGPPLPPAVAAANDQRGGHTRSQVLGGARAATQFWRTYDVSGRPILGRMFEHGMRHILTPEINYVYESTPTLRQEELPQNDAVTEQDGLHRVNLALRNRWQTRRAPVIERDPRAPLGGEWHRRKVAAEQALESAPFNVIDFDNDIDLYINRHNLVDFRTGDERRFSNLRSQLAFRPSRSTTLFTKTEYNVVRAGSAGAGGFETIAAGFKYQPTERLVFGVREDYHLHDVTLTRFDMAWDISPKWALAFDVGQDVSGGGTWDKSLQLTRRFHEWEMTFSYSFDKGKGESVGMVQIGPSRARTYRPSWLFQPRIMPAFYFVETQQ